MKPSIGITIALWLLSLVAACSAAAPSNPPVPSAVASTAALSASSPVPRSLPPTVNPAAMFPRCNGMQVLTDPIRFNWPNIDQRIRELEGSFWTYLACEQLQPEVASLYRAQLPNPPYNLHEMNWLERNEGTVGIYFTRAGTWKYVWIVPQPEDPQKSYVIVAESISAINC